MTSFVAWMAIASGGLFQADKAEDEKKAADAIKGFKVAYATAGDAEADRIKAVRLLADVVHKKTSSVLAGLLLNGGEMTGVRVAAADALGTFRGVEGASKLLIAASQQRDKRTDVRRAACRALGELRAEDALGVLHSILQDKQADVAREAAIALGKIRHKGSVPVLIDLLRDVERVADANEAAPLAGTGVALAPVGNNPQAGGKLGGLAGMALSGGIASGDARREQEERRLMLQDPTNKALASITREKWTTGKEWTIWWGKNGSTFQVQK